MNKEINKLKEDLKNYIKAYNILMGYWESIPDEDKIKVHKQLEKLGL